jgi:gliding motility-associated-like protein
MARILLFFLFIIGFSKVYATHIVGGEIELEHLNNYNYQVRMVLYFDNYRGNPLAEDYSARVGIFRKRDDLFMQSLVLNNMGSVMVEYTNPICVIAQLNTRKILYSGNITLFSDIYNDPEGYYIVWERCCRNDGISNIILPGATAQTFYMEFPPVIVDGKQFINSSPILFPPLSDYACVNRDFYADFTGIDKDGDSLVYSLTNPWSGNTSTFQPILPSPLPKPYTHVNWAPGVDINNMIPGNPSLQISNRGILKVNASQEGLYVFAIKCEEFRDGIKIGEVRRDFQMFVIDCHKPGSPPSAMVQVGDRPPTSTIDTIRISPGNPGCFKMFVTDPDVPETIRFRASPVNFSGRLNDLFSGVSGVITDSDSPIVVDLCLPECPLTNQRFAVIDLIAMDDECSVPLTDTVRLVIDYLEVLNTAPYFMFQEDTLNFTLGHSDIFELPIEGRDDENSFMTLGWVAENFNDANYSMGFNIEVNEEGVLRYNFTFDTDCSNNDFSENNEFLISLLLRDTNTCGNPPLSSKLVINLTVDIPENHAPVIIVDREVDDIALKIGESLSFPVVAKDPDNDPVTVTGHGIGFNLEDYGIVFLPKEGKGSVTSNFLWNPGCEININQKDEFQVLLVAEDRNSCHSVKKDTLIVNIKLSPPENQAPQIVNQLGALSELIIGESFEIDVMAVDADGDIIYLDLLNREELKSMYNIEFEPKEGASSVNSIFRYVGNCDHLGEGFTATEMDLVFFVRDDKCYNPMADTVAVRIQLSDVPANADEFLPPNVFTPNGDEYNPYFTMPNLPNNNCFAEFNDIQIYNRWGILVFESTHRDFAWDGGNSPAGIYYYILNYTKFKYRGIVSILK